EDLTCRPSSATAAEEDLGELLQSNAVAVTLDGRRPYALDHGQLLDVGKIAVFLAVTDDGVGLGQTDPAQGLGDFRSTGLVDVDRNQRRFAHFRQNGMGEQDAQTQHDGAYQ